MLNNYQSQSASGPLCATIQDSQELPTSTNMMSLIQQNLTETTKFSWHSDWSKGRTTSS